MNEELELLRQGIEALELQREAIGDHVADISIEVIRQKIEALSSLVHEEKRKQVTILFADLCGFTAMSANMDSEEIRDTINALWDYIDKIIHDHGGLVDKHIGDSVMALWGVRASHENDAERAIDAALDIQKNFEEWSAKYTDIQGIRIGLNTGMVVLGEVGNIGEYTAMGDAVNIASRLEGAAPVGGILISQATYAIVRGAFDLRECEPIEIKGIALPIKTYVVFARKQIAFNLRIRGVEGIETPMIGREGELALLKGLLQRTIQERKLIKGIIAGEAGIGKSRLLLKFENSMDLLPEVVYTLNGRATEAAKDIPYSLFRDVFFNRFGILESDAANVARVKLEQAIGNVMSGDVDAHMKAI